MGVHFRAQLDRLIAELGEMCATAADAIVAVVDSDTAALIRHSRRETALGGL